jgi:hypothetical protein
MPLAYGVAVRPKTLLFAPGVGPPFTRRTREFSRKSPGDLDDHHMNINDLRVMEPRQLSDRSEGAARARSSLLVVVGVFLAIAGAVLVVASEPDNGVDMMVGFGLLLVGASTCLTFAERGHAPSHARRNDGVTRQDDARKVLLANRSHESSSMQLGPDPEQVIGRQTGART